MGMFDRTGNKFRLAICTVLLLSIIPKVWAEDNWARIVPVYYWFSGFDNSKRIIDMENSPSVHNKAIMTSVSWINSATMNNPNGSSSVPFPMQDFKDDNAVVMADVAWWAFANWDAVVTACESAVTNGAMVINTNEMTHPSPPTMGSSQFTDLRNTCQAVNPEALVGITEESEIELTTHWALNARPDFVALEWYLGDGANKFDTMITWAHDRNIKFAMWVSTFAGSHSFPEKIAETFYKADSVFVWAPTEAMEWEATMKPAIDTIFEHRQLFTASDGTEIAAFDDDGNVAIGGTVTTTGTSPHANPAFEIINTNGLTVATMNDIGDLWLLSGVLAGQSTDDLDSHKGLITPQVFSIEDSNGVTQSLIDGTGELQLKGFAIFEEATP